MVWGFTAVLGRLIDLPAVEVVFFRCAIAAGTLAAWQRFRSGRVSTRLDQRESTASWPVVFQWWLIGSLIAIHWILFFAAVKVGSVSIAMIGLATLSLWTAILEPLMVRGRRYHGGEFVLATVIVMAVVFIFGDQDRANALGFLLAIASAILAAIFSILNVRYTHRYDPKQITMHQMCGAAFLAMVLCVAAWQSSGAWLIEPSQRLAWPSGSAWLGLALLGVICTVYAYVEFVDLLSRLSVFSVIFANNLEPMYGIILGGIIFGEHRELTPRFFIGGGVIVAAVMLQTFLAANRRRVANRRACEGPPMTSNCPP